MVENIQRYGLSARRWRGFVNSVCRYRGLPVHRGAKPDSLTTPHFSEKISSPKTRNDENRLAFSPIFRLMGRALEGAVIVVI
jgi:hypothetical protein